MNIPNQLNPFNYMGSKYSILPWLLPLLPRTKSFVEVFGGSMVVTLNRDQVPIETYNDINKRVVNFFKVLRERTEELITALYLTPHSRHEYEEAWDDETADDVERARRFFIRVRQSFLSTGSQLEKKGWLSATKETRCKISEATNKYLKSVEGLDRIVERMKHIQIECRSREFILGAYDTPETLFYLDPPYDNEKRNSNSYEYDFGDADHIKLRDSLTDVKALAALSGYDSNFYIDLYGNLVDSGKWWFTPGPKRKNNFSTKQARECLWTNYDPYHVQGGKLFN